MRGGAQSHLIEAGDGNFYVVKFLNNPQHRRVLINEAVAYALLRYLQIAAPEVAVVSVSAGFLAANPEVSLQLGSHRVPVEPGWHFGSRYPGDPDQLAVYDFLPDALLGQVVNLREFIGMLAFETYVYLGTRQCRYANTPASALEQGPAASSAADPPSASA